MGCGLCRAKREFLESKVKDVEGQLQSAKADKAATGRERKMEEAVAHMMRNIPGEPRAHSLPSAPLRHASAALLSSPPLDQERVCLLGLPATAIVPKPALGHVVWDVCVWYHLFL